MKEQHYKTILYFIIAAIIGTLAIQGYWNYKNFEAGKQQLINDVQVSLDNAVNNYYATKTEERFRNFTFVEDLKSADSIVNRFRSDSIFKGLNEFDSISLRTETDLTVFIDIEDDGNLTPRILKKDTKASADSLYKIFRLKDSIGDNFFNLQNKNDSLFKHPLAELTSTVMYAMAAKKVDLKAIDSLLMKEFNRKRIYINFSLYFQNPFGEDQHSGYISDARSYLSTRSSSAFLPKHSFLQINFSNVPETVLKRNSIGLLISLLFVIAISGCLLYLLRVIKNQKQLAEVKNDLISNITHEFKTPLATIGAAMEGIQVFNKANDTEKTLKYAQISSNQVTKLTTMVEKLLETATLDGEQLELNFETTDISALLASISQKETFLSEAKNITFNPCETLAQYPVDRFHFENAMNNILDNAINYGGDAIVISVANKTQAIAISIEDNGTVLTAAQSKQLFEKFYRVPKGNTHDVKGFGIGLYYTKAIIEKHGGAISVSVNPTKFKITLPHG
jgi:two-component system phosphate regulon sensor histidine kinase PhoR